MPRTIIDILRKGNQEQFHSSMVAWLLDPKGEHGYGAAFLQGFAGLVEEKGFPAFRSSLLGAGTATVYTEATASKGRHDIRLTLDTTRVVIENKTKSLGAAPQFDRYADAGNVLVALGLCDISFSDEVKARYPVVTYSEVLSLLDQLPDPPASDFGVLVGHYRRFLRRELSTLEMIDRWHEGGGPAQAVCEAADAGGMNQNDRRFLNYYLLERCRRGLLGRPAWGHCRAKMDKDMQSGVWLALFGLENEPGTFRYSAPLAGLWTQHRASVWLHIELWDGVLAGADDATAGVVQLRCQAGAAREVVAGFSQARPLLEAERYADRVKRNARTFFLTERPLLRQHLTASSFPQQVEAFAASLGTFGGQEAMQGHTDGGGS